MSLTCGRRPAALVLPLLLLAAAASAQTRPATPAPAEPARPTGSGVISGTVRNAADTAPLARARVTATADALPEPRVAITDAAGAYTIADLPPGQYVVSVTRSGFAPQVYGESHVSESRPVAVANGRAAAGIDVSLAPGGVIAGRILDEDGSPFAGAVVDALMTRSDHGSDVLVSVSTSYTDDRGEYRLFGLAAGQYFVSASDPAFRAVSTPKGVLHYSPTYFPGVVFADQAAPLTVAVKGSTRADFTLKLVPPVRVQGLIAAYDRRPLLSAAVIMSPIVGAGVPVVPTGDAIISPDGRFAFGEVVPGHYRIRARGQTDAAGAAIFADFPVAVSGEDIDSVTLTLRPGATLDGSVLFEAKHGTHPPSPGSLRISVPFTDGSDFGDALTGAVQGDGRYRIRGIMSGSHQIVVDGLQPPWIVSSITYQGGNIADLALPVEDRETYHDVRVLLSDDGSVVSGTVVSGGRQPVADVGVLVFPRTPLFWLRTSRRLRVAYTDAAGRFEVAGLPAGDYLAVASATIDPSDLGRRDRLQQLEPLAVPFVLATGSGRVNVALTVTAAAQALAPAGRR